MKFGLDFRPWPHLKCSAFEIEQRIGNVRHDIGSADDWPVLSQIDVVQSTQLREQLAWTKLNRDKRARSLQTDWK